MPTLFMMNHAGVHLIKKYYPAYKPRAEDFERARWGTSARRRSKR
jgi:hypothetical protein